MAGKVNRISRFNVTSLALGLAFLYLPIVILVIYSFNASRGEAPRSLAASISDASIFVSVA